MTDYKILAESYFNAGGKIDKLKNSIETLHKIGDEKVRNASILKALDEIKAICNMFQHDGTTVNLDIYLKICEIDDYIDKYISQDKWMNLKHYTQEVIAKHRKALLALEDIKSKTSRDRDNELLSLTKQIDEDSTALSAVNLALLSNDEIKVQKLMLNQLELLRILADCERSVPQSFRAVFEELRKTIKASLAEDTPQVTAKHLHEILSKIQSMEKPTDYSELSANEIASYGLLDTMGTRLEQIQKTLEAESKSLESEASSTRTLKH